MVKSGSKREAIEPTSDQMKQKAPKGMLRERMVATETPLDPGKSSNGPLQRTRTILRIQPTSPVPHTATKMATGAAMAAFLTSSEM